MGFCRGLPRHGAPSGQRLGTSVRLANAGTGSPEPDLIGGDVKIGGGSFLLSVGRPKPVLPAFRHRADPVRGGDFEGGCLSALDIGIVDRLVPGDDVPRSHGGIVPGVDRSDLARDRGGYPWFLRPEDCALKHFLNERLGGLSGGTAQTVSQRAKETG